MDARRAEQVRFPMLDRILGAVARLVVRGRSMVEVRAELEQCEPGEVARIAHDLSVTPNELKVLARKGPNSASEMDQLLAALGVDRSQRPFNEPALIQDMQRLCSVCESKRQCADELAAETAAAHYRAYCPNAYTLDHMIERGRGRAAAAPEATTP
jgi:hypothetical protein